MLPTPNIVHYTLKPVFTASQKPAIYIVRLFI
jgi:hypothetical protein